MSVALFQPDSLSSGYWMQLRKPSLYHHFRPLVPGSLMRQNEQGNIHPPARAQNIPLMASTRVILMKRISLKHIHNALPVDAWITSPSFGDDTESEFVHVADTFA